MEKLMKQENATWERLASVIELAGMSINYFAHHIGLPVAENLYRIKRGQNGISRDLADKIVSKFPKISKGWLMTGEGQMFFDEEYLSERIPYYDRNIEEVLAGASAIPAYHISVPVAGKCELAVRFGYDAATSAEVVYILARTSEEKLLDGCEYLFLIEKSLSLRKWRVERPLKMGADDKVFVIKGRLYIYRDTE